MGGGKGGGRIEKGRKQGGRRRKKGAHCISIFSGTVHVHAFLTPSNTSLSAAGSSSQGHSEVANMRMAVEEGREWSVERNMAWNVSVVTSHQELIRGIKTTEGATRLASRNTYKRSWTV